MSAYERRNLYHEKTFLTQMRCFCPVIRTLHPAVPHQTAQEKTEICIHLLKKKRNRSKR